MWNHGRAVSALPIAGNVSMAPRTNVHSDSRRVINSSIRRSTTDACSSQGLDESHKSSYSITNLKLKALCES